MRTAVFFTFLILAYSQQGVSACTINSFAKIVKINKTLDSSIIKSSDCNDEIQRTFIEFVSSAAGNLNSQNLSHIFKAEYKYDITFKPKKISIDKVSDFLTNLLSLPSDTVLTKLTSLYGNASIQLNKSDTTSAICQECINPGSKNIKLHINKKSIWLTGHIYIKRTGLILNQELNPFQNKLSQKLFSKKVFYDDGRVHLFKDIEQIRFYQTNKRLPKGRVLKVTDLSAITLIKPGQKIKIILKGKSISLKSSAYSRASGRIGDFIEVYNQKTNKKITAQVVDFNTVMVEL